MHLSFGKGLLNRYVISCWSRILHWSCFELLIEGKICVQAEGWRQTETERSNCVTNNRRCFSRVIVVQDNKIPKCSQILRRSWGTVLNKSVHNLGLGQMFTSPHNSKLKYTAKTRLEWFGVSHWMSLNGPSKAWTWTPANICVETWGRQFTEHSVWLSLLGSARKNRRNCPNAQSLQMSLLKPTPAAKGVLQQSTALNTYVNQRFLFLIIDKFAKIVSTPLLWVLMHLFIWQMLKPQYRKRPWTSGNWIYFKLLPQQN